MRKKILFTSNCFGEDRSAALIALELKRMLKEKGLEIDVSGASLISEGKDYSSRGIDLLFSSYVPPSGGFPTRSLKGFIADLFHLTLLSDFVKAVKKAGDGCVLCVVVGDISLLFLTRLALKNCPVLFLAPAKSDYIEGHYAVERWYMKKNAVYVLTHDEFTAENLRKKDIKALFLGNPMMDGLELKGENILIEKQYNNPVIGIFPGSRNEAYDNFNMILDLIEHIPLPENENLTFLTAVSGSLDIELIRAKSARYGWKFADKDKKISLLKNGTEVQLCKNYFKEILHISDIIIGLAGTANEQAAGMGKPIIGFKGMGPQTTVRRMEEQERLLGGALKFARNYPDDALKELLLLIKDPAERKARGEAGKKRMGPEGGARNIAEFIIRDFL